MRSAFAVRGKTGVGLAWWHANTFPKFHNFPQHRFADVLDEIIGNALAIGAIGGEIDSASARGVVDEQ